MEILYAQNVSQSGSGIAAFLPILLIGVVFYIFILRPQTKQKKQHETMLNNLKKGDKILTRGGLYGKVVNFQGKKDHKVIIDIGSDIKVNIARSYITNLTEPNESK